MLILKKKPESNDQMRYTGTIYAADKSKCLTTQKSNLRVYHFFDVTKGIEVDKQFTEDAETSCHLLNQQIHHVVFEAVERTDVKSTPSSVDSGILFHISQVWLLPSSVIFSFPLHVK